MERIRLASGSRFGLFVLVCLHIIICCTSLVQVAHWQSYMLYDAARLTYAIAAVLAFSTVSLLFIFARFSFGYFIGFSLFTMVLGFIWLNTFSKFNYDHRLAGLSAAASAVLFLLPALLDQRARQTDLRAIASRPPVPAEIHSGAGAGHDRRGLILQFQAGVDQADLRFSQRTLLSGADTLPDRNCVHGAAAIRLCLLSGAQSPLVGCRAPASDAAVLSDHAQQVCAFFNGMGRCPADAFEDFRAQSRNHPVGPPADASRRDLDGSAISTTIRCIISTW